MSEPWMEADAREKRWDDYAASFPRCALCNRSIVAGKKYYSARHQVVCKSCKEELDDNWDYVEVDDD